MFEEEPRVLVMVAHPDDEWWGIGGTILRLKKEYEATVDIYIVSDGERGDGVGKERMKASSDLHQEIGSIGLAGNIPANSLPFYLETIDKIDDIVNRQNITYSHIFTHYEFDTHQDHRAVFHAVMSAIRNSQMTYVYQIETPFKRNFNPNFWVNITKYMDQKMELYDRYFSYEASRRYEFNPMHMERVFAYRGFEGLCVDYAEGFIYTRGALF